MRKTKEQIEREYFDRIKRTIFIDFIDLKDGRHIAAIAGIIGKSVEDLSRYLKEWKKKDIYGQPE